ncbi:MAG: F0F1 ATP synthase subunit gamma [Alphaproteobacteria bacterium]|nr:F0F1 ATP synthase subunit gamma [Alphaproteobacteria bacterium]
MPSLKDLKNRISSVRSTQKITKAMQMVAAAKFKRAEEAAEAARPYATRMAAMTRALGIDYAGRPDLPKLLAGTGSDRTHLLIVMTAERGLCGGFNSSIARMARDHANRLIAAGKTVKIMTIGKKGNDVLRRLFKDRIVETITLRDVRQIGYANAEALGEKIVARFAAGEFDVATLFYSRFNSVISQEPTALQIIPAYVDEGENEVLSYEFEPSEHGILAEILPRNINVQIFAALLENGAGEMGAKMSAMDSATRNAGDMIDKLTLSYNRRRQAQITKELIEIISGAEAL